MNAALCLVVMILGIALADTSQPISVTNMDFSAWDTLLARYVTYGTIDGIQLHKVDYARMANDSLYKTFALQMAEANLQDFDQDDFYAFWINAYNYLTVKTIVENPCKTDIFSSGCGRISSILQVGVQQPSVFTPVWSRVAGTIAYSQYSLTQAMQILRSGKFPLDPRFHACIVCASVSCPNLRLQAYIPANISAQMTSQLSEFLANPLKGSSLDTTRSVLTLSPMFQTYASDFQQRNTTLLEYLFNFLPTSIAEYTRNNPSVTVQYFQYDWNLNGGVSTLCSSIRPCFPWWALVTLSGGVVICLTILIVCLCRSCRKRSGYAAIN